MRGLVLIMGFQLLGSLLSGMLPLPLPGAIIGLLLFFGYLLLTGGGFEPERRTGALLTRWLPLLFVPAGVGVMTYGDLLRAQALPITLALTLGTLVAFVLTALLMKHLGRPQSQKEPSSD